MKYNEEDMIDVYSCRCVAIKMDRKFRLTNPKDEYFGITGDYIVKVGDKVVGMNKDVFEALFTKEGD